MSATIVALHGFLGCGADWAAVQAASSFRARWVCPDLFAPSTNGFARPPEISQAWLVGYSFGARLALRWLTGQPERWQGALLLSVNPGNFMTDAQRAEREQADRRWAAAFRAEGWEAVLARWNTQQIFSGRGGPSRREADFDRARLAEALENHSVAGQFTDQAKLPGRLVWLAGAEDGKFVSLLGSMRSTGFPGTFSTVAGAGHRLLFDAPGAVAAALDQLTA
ncbi:MAG: hypothetical protein ACOYOL_02685 [Chthoniobacterales bacterium]|jgi:2-succinyl-6-hydroxy-2,4-cyclohexadiene-1-carboxylate synthase